MGGTVFRITADGQGYGRIVPGIDLGAFAAEARRLDHGWVGGEHVLLALLASPSVASETLEELGVSYATIEEHARTRPTDRRPRVNGTGVSPATYAILGRAEAFAVTDGTLRPRPEHWLLALVWDERGSAVQALYHAGATQVAVLEGLSRRGVRVPDLDPPEYRPWRGHRTIEVDAAELQPLIDVLRKDHPPASEWRWGFNWTNDEARRAVVVAEEGIDLDAALLASRSVGDDLA
jgi:hypothetical protein